ncbi:hypothetical protein [Hyalangium rubrum]|uniref:Lipoprotein n=1 Tax=Hyalangium rubrum TaxID=3103134 RepID=A0ABU5GZ73_9BACT|nr:hypothetical protein [Hyalangium sp. s54d21]MDY7226473.1 hypothetical protein [Hyalangium sp. s54d21]
MRRSCLSLLAVLLAVGCSRPVSSQALGFEYEPPSGVKLSSEEPGPPAVARFEGGVEVRSVPGTPPALEALPEAVLGAAGVSVPGKRVSTSQGTLPAGPVARYEFQEGTHRTLVYFLPRPDRFLLFTFTAPERDYGPRSAKVELSLSTLKLLR